jgi:uncharacterized damage-inducible protein DinB
MEACPEILERLRGTPLRVAERSSSAPPHLLTVRIGGAWSIQDHVGHLLDLEALWAGRLDDFDGSLEALRPADLENRATWGAEHISRPLGDLLAGFHGARSELVARCEGMDEQDLARTAFHPRLRQLMSVADLLFFVAEHDDHHLASITQLIRRGG